jgi:hypothetical protein
MKTIGWCAIAFVMVGCKDDKAAPKTEAPAPKPVAAPDGAVAVAPAASCDLVGTLDLKRGKAGAGCGQAGRYDSIRLELASATARGDALDLEIRDSDALGNVMATAETKAAPVAGICAVTLTIADAGRADDDESFTYVLDIPVAGGAVKGTLAHAGVDAKGKECTSDSSVGGMFTRGAAAAAKPAADGGHATLEAYCEKRTAGFVAADCDTPGEGDMCSCTAAPKDVLAGTITAKGTGLVQEAALVVAAPKAADYAQCDVAVKLDSGWWVAPAVFPCGPAPVSHDGGISVTVDSFTADGDQVQIAWTEQSSAARAKPVKRKASCKATAGAAPTCTVAK